MRKEWLWTDLECVHFPLPPLLHWRRCLVHRDSFPWQERERGSSVSWSFGRNFEDWKGLQVFYRTATTLLLVAIKHIRGKETATTSFSTMDARDELEKAEAHWQSIMKLSEIYCYNCLMHEVLNVHGGRSQFCLECQTYKCDIEGIEHPKCMKDEFYCKRCYTDLDAWYRDDAEERVFWRHYKCCERRRTFIWKQMLDGHSEIMKWAKPFRFTSFIKSKK